MNINLILTGGTVGSATDGNGIINTDTKVASDMLIDDFFDRHPEYRGTVEFDVTAPLDLLSENLNLGHWNILVDHLIHINLKKSDGVIITHGTDTLAFTANLMSLLLYGIDVPVFIVASSKPLTDKILEGSVKKHKPKVLDIPGLEASDAPEPPDYLEHFNRAMCRRTFPVCRTCFMRLRTGWRKQAVCI